MKRTLCKLVLCFSLMMWIGLTNNELTTFADEGNGGQVNRKGKISFYEDSTDLDVTEKPTDTSNKPLPNTGELIKNYSFIGGMVLILVFVLLFLRRRGKGEEE